MQIYLILGPIADLLDSFIMNRVTRIVGYFLRFPNLEAIADWLDNIDMDHVMRIVGLLIGFEIQEQLQIG